MHLSFLEIHSFWPWTTINDQYIENFSFERMTDFVNRRFVFFFFPFPLLSLLKSDLCLSENYLSAYSVHSNTLLFLFPAWLPGPDCLMLPHGLVRCCWISLHFFHPSNNISIHYFIIRQVITQNGDGLNAFWAIMGVKKISPSFLLVSLVGLIIKLL